MTKQRWLTAGSVLLWLAAWQAASVLIGIELYLPSPLRVLGALFALSGTELFWLSVASSLWRISLGFVLGLVLGCSLAALAAAVRWVEVLLRPLMLLARATPVSSFIILALVWFSSKNISVFVSFWMVLPVLYASTLSGIRAADARLLEMARVFRLSPLRRARAIYLPALRAPLLAAVELGYGMCWKSGVAAEVIGLPRGTVGERMYQAKIYLQMAEMFAWTAVVIFLSWAVGRLAFWLIRAGTLRLERLCLRHGGTPPAYTAGAAALEGVSKAYGPLKVLCGFDLRLPAGARLALRGESGIGKTTVARLLLGLETPDTGSVQAPALASAVFQEDRLCENLTAVQNLALVLPRGRGMDLEAALGELGLGPLDIHKPAAALSGGQKRRVALARALVAPGGLVVLDEAFKGLDEAGRQAAYAFVRRHLGPRTLLVVTHDESEAAALAGQSISM